MTNPSNDKANILSRVFREGRRPVDNTLLGAARTRWLLSVLLALGVITTAFNLPWYPVPGAMSWKSLYRSDEIVLLPPQKEEIIEEDEIDGGIITFFDETLPEDEEKEEEEDEAEDDSDAEDEPEPVPEAERLERLEVSPVLEFAQQNPSIIGGLGSLYLNIDYPLSARNKGIQGLSVLEFIVNEDGSTSDFEVIKPLHPACDSAAVAAVKQTRFKPGVHNGEVVRVKMRLPIRFKLVKRYERYLREDTLKTPPPSS